MISRRAFLSGVLATGATACAGGTDRSASTASTRPRPTITPPEPPPVGLASDPFTLGVASGDPDATSVVLWTRLAPDPLVAGAGLPGDDVVVAWEVAVADDFRDLVAAGLVPGVAGLAHSVHVVVEDLDPATAYRYRFRVGGFTSRVGTTRTAPPDDVAAPARLAVASCQRYDHGLWAAHRDIAASDVDLVVFLGDYVYEAATASDATRPLPGDPEVASDLDGYRLRYAAARLDADLAAAHAAHPWVVTWDDHEVRNDYAGGASDEDERARRAAGYQAWYEHQPVRLPPPDGADYPIHRAVRWGSTLELLVLDTRQHRSEQGCGGGIGAAGCPERAVPERTLLGADQEAWLLDRLSDASSSWTALAQQVVLAPIGVLGEVNLDAWDGYAAQRDRVVDALPTGAVVLTGDIHAALVADVPGTDGALVATELVTPSISSRFDQGAATLFGFLPSVAEHVRYADASHRGWLSCDVDEERWRIEHRAVADAGDAASAVTTVATFEIAAGIPGAERV